MISRKLMHQVSNRLQVILGSIDLAELETDEAKRAYLFDKARTEIRQLTDLLNTRVKPDVQRKKK